VEAKAHVGEMTSSCSAMPKSREQIVRSLDQVKKELGAVEEADWLKGYYQLANRLAHHWFLRQHGVDAWLVLIQFTGKTRMPTSSARESLRTRLCRSDAASGVYCLR
jgi:hypothetical protein